MHWLDPLERIWPHLVAGLAFLGALLASIHALLNKRDSRAAVLWLGFIWLMPFLGPIYIHARRQPHSTLGTSLRAESSPGMRRAIPDDMGEWTSPKPNTCECWPGRGPSRHATAGRRQRIQALISSDEAFPAMP
jgi:cardiolipin synthase